VKTHVEVRLDGDIGHIVLIPDPATKPPAFDQSSIAELNAAVACIEKTLHLVRVVVLSSASDRHFLVGANIHALSQLSADTIADWVRDGHRVFNRLENLPLPVIAKVEGNAVGGGLELAMACDFILAGPAARFGLPEPCLGLITGWGGAWRLAQRIGRSKASELLYTGQLIDAQRALDIGLCDLHGTVEELDAWIERFVNVVRALSPASIAETKAMLLEIHGSARKQMCDLEAAASQRLMALPDTASRLQAFFEQRNRPC
jgi:enoyl-CoA hydratase